VSGNHTSLRKIEREARKAERRLAKQRQRRRRGQDRQGAAQPSAQGG
jgi:hypothetical protein